MEELEIKRPEHPLPDELEKLDESETVCKFCGISYLIHREVAKLKDELEKTQQKMKEMEDLVTNAERYKSELSSVTVLYDKLKDDTESERTKFEQLQKSKRELHQKYSDLYKSNERSKINLKQKNESLVKMVLDNIRQSKSELTEMRDDQRKMIESWESSKAAFVENISVQHYYRLKNSTSEITDKYELKLKSLNEEYVNLENEKSELTMKIEHQSEVIEEHVNSVKSAQISNDQLEKANNNLVNELEDLKIKNSRTKTEVDHLTALFKSANDELARGKVEKSNANATVEKLESDLSEMKALFNHEMSMRVSKQEQLEIELKGLQHELLEKEELLRTSVSMEDMKKVQNE